MAGQAGYLREFNETNVRWLRQQDQTAIERLLESDHGYGLFLRSTLLSYGFTDNEVHYWGAFSDAKQTTLNAILMCVGGSANIYAAKDGDIMPLARVALEQRLRFIMGPGALIAQIVALAGPRVARIEEHCFAELPQHRFHRQPVPHEATIRTGLLSDVPALTQLYMGASGFEELAPTQIRTIMRQRVVRFRTMVADVSGALVAAASTSAETPDAAMIGGVWTAPTARERGYSTAVVAALCNNLLREHCRPYLFFLNQNDIARHIYTKIGFRVTGIWQVCYLKEHSR
jgi:uncharacterized protein